MNFEESRIIPVDIEKEMKKSYLAYSMSVIVGRALPDVRDGLKPVHRRILYTMYENGLTPDKAYRKCADTVGSVLGRFHPHGDSSVYDALVRMAQDFSLRYPLIDGQGNFGSVDGDNAAAYRYTEARMSKISTNLITNIEKETVDFTPNYDDRLMEPSVLPSRFPNLLVNGSTGIAVGMATNIPPHNLGEVIDGIIYLMGNADATPIDLMDFIKAPDFPTGGIIMGHSGIRSAYCTGRGKITLRGRAVIEEDKSGKSSIIINEIPYMVNKSRLITSFADLVKDKKVEGITNLRDESDRDGMRIVVELRRDVNPQIILNQLYKFSQLQETVGVIMLALNQGQPKIFNLKEVLESYIEFQVSIVRRRTEFDLRKAKERCHILEGLKIALDYIDEVIKILRKSKTINEGKQALIERFKLSDLQSAAIVQMRLGQLTGLEKVKIEDELKEILEKIKEFEFILANHYKILEIIKEELIFIKDKYNDERRTSIETVTGEVDIEDLIKEEECVVTITNLGYIKRLPVGTYKSQKRGGRGVTGVNNREEDFVAELFTSSTHDYILFLTNKGRVYRKKCYQVPEGSRTSRGLNIKNILPLEDGERVSSMLRTREFSEDKYLIMVTTNGIIKRTALSHYDTSRKTGIIAINLDESDELAWVYLSNGNDNIVIATKNGMSIRINENDARPLGRTARGVKAITLKTGDKVVGLAPVIDGSKLLTITEKGQGRRSSFDDYRLQSRGGKGSINYKATNENGLVASVRTVADDDDVILITNDGIIIRTSVDSISVQSRYAKGVKVMRVSNDQKIITVAGAEKYNEEDEIDETEED
ncbi:MAG: DNA gyrase subunit A [Oscillospiraceae bacterium]